MLDKTLFYFSLHDPFQARSSVQRSIDCLSSNFIRKRASAVDYLKLSLDETKYDFSIVQLYFF